jgi:hypothetical protein
MQWTSCCRDRRRNCPSIATDGGFLLIRDDDGVVARVKLESAYDLILTIQDTMADTYYTRSTSTCATS